MDWVACMWRRRGIRLRGFEFSGLKRETGAPVSFLFGFSGEIKKIGLRVCMTNGNWISHL